MNKGSYSNLPKLKGTLLKEWRPISICIGIASVFWFFQSMSLDYDTHLFVQVEYTNQPEQLILVNKPAKSLDIFVEGNGWDLLSYKLSFSKPIFEVDLSTYEKSGKYPTAEVKGIIASQMAGIKQIKSVLPTEIQLDFEKAKEKSVPIVYNGILSCADGYGLVNEMSFSPAEITLRGPTSIIDSIEYIETEKVLAIQQEGEIEIEVAIQLPTGVSSNSNKVKMTGRVEQLTQKSLSIPIQHQMKGITLIPARATLQFQVPLSLYNSAKVSNFELKAEAPKTADQELLPLKVSTKLFYVKNMVIQPAYVNYVINH